MSLEAKSKSGAIKRSKQIIEELDIPKTRLSYTVCLHNVCKTGKNAIPGTVWKTVFNRKSGSSKWTASETYLT